MVVFLIFLNYYLIVLTGISDLIFTTGLFIMLNLFICFFFIKKSLVFFLEGINISSNSSTIDTTNIANGDSGSIITGSYIDGLLFFNIIFKFSRFYYLKTFSILNFLFLFVFKKITNFNFKKWQY